MIRRLARLYTQVRPQWWFRLTAGATCTLMAGVVLMIGAHYSAPLCIPITMLLAAMGIAYLVEP